MMHASSRRIVLASCSLSLSLLLPARAHAEDARIAACQKQADACSKAFLASKYEWFISHCNTDKIIELGGGKTKLQADMEDALKKMKLQSASFVSLKASAPTEIITEGSDAYAILPTNVVLKIKDQSVAKQSFLLAVSSDRGKNWRFIEGANLTDEALKAVVPKMPSRVKLPRPLGAESNGPDGHGH